jgi:tetratricopeptide (TPR) repeat protein
VTTSSRDLFESGKAHYLEGRFDLAEPLLREAIIKCSAEDWFLLGQVRYSWALCLHAQSRDDEAESAILQTLSDTPSRTRTYWSHLLYADIKFSQSKFNEAGDIYWSAFESVLQEDPDFYIEHEDVDVFADIWTCFFLAQSPERVEQMLPHLPFDEESIGQLLAQIALPHTSHEYGGSYAQMPLESCARCLELSYQLNPIPSTLGLLGRHLETGGQAKAAISVYRQMAVSFPDDFDEDSARSFGWALEKEGLIEEAEVWLRKSALEYCPEDFYEVEPLLTFYGQYQRWIDAREVLEIHISSRLFKPQLNRDADLVLAWNLHARCSELLGEYQIAEESRLQARINLEQLLRNRIATSQSHPNLAITHFWLAECLKTHGRVDEAEASFNIAKQRFIAETNDDGDRWWGHHWLGRFYEEHEDFELAEAHFQAALQLASPASHLDNSSLGRVLVKRGHLDKAERLLRKNSDVYSKYWLAKCLLARGMSTEAERLFSEVTEKAPFSFEFDVSAHGFSQELSPRP